MISDFMYITEKLRDLEEKYLDVVDKYQLLIHQYMELVEKLEQTNQTEKTNEDRT